MESYVPDGGYSKGVGMQEKYNSWAAAQYREKVSIKVALSLAAPTRASIQLDSTDAA